MKVNYYKSTKETETYPNPGKEYYAPSNVIPFDQDSDATVVYVENQSYFIELDVMDCTALGGPNLVLRITSKGYSEFRRSLYSVHYIVTDKRNEHDYHEIPTMLMFPFNITFSKRAVEYVSGYTQVALEAAANRITRVGRVIKTLVDNREIEPWVLGTQS